MTKAKVVDLDTYSDKGFTLYNYVLNSVQNDILFVQYVDESEDGTHVMRNGIAIPVTQMTKAWRIGKVVLAGEKAQQVKVGDYVCFPNDKGIPVSNINVKDKGIISNGIFLNEDRVFGVCTPME